MQVLLILNHAPDYRESFLRQLGTRVDLTVGAQPCAQDGLVPPDRRDNYAYVEIPSIRIPRLAWQPRLRHHLDFAQYDIICCNFNPRQTPWLILFLTHPAWRKKWLWWGPVYGQTQSFYMKILRKLILSRAAGCLVYSEPIARQVTAELGIDAVSFNNTEINRDEFQPGRFDSHPGLRLLFVGRCQPRKRLERLVELARRRPDISVRLIGPGMEQLNIPAPLLKDGRITTLGHCIGAELIPHFNWADLVANPGHAGLLVMNAARHGTGIVLDADSTHAPEYWLAKEADQPFISFGDQAVTDRFFDNLIDHKDLLQQWGDRLQAVAREKYTIEHMVEAHCQTFNKIATASRRPK